MFATVSKGLELAAPCTSHCATRFFVAKGSHSPGVCPRGIVFLTKRGTVGKAWEGGLEHAGYGRRLHMAHLECGQIEVGAQGKRDCLSRAPC